jgi:hypothetical protein
MEEETKALKETAELADAALAAAAEVQDKTSSADARGKRSTATQRSKVAAKQSWEPHHDDVKSFAPRRRRTAAIVASLALSPVSPVNQAKGAKGKAAKVTAAQARKSKENASSPLPLTRAGTRAGRRDGGTTTTGLSRRSRAAARDIGPSVEASALSLHLTACCA